MASRMASRATDPGLVATLASVADRLRADPELPLRRRQDMLAALNTAAQVLGHSLTQLPAEPTLLGRRLAEASPQAHGVALRRWANIRSLVGAALARAVPVGATRRQQPLDPRWETLHAKLEPRFRQMQLASLSRFCTARGISPEAVDTHVFAEYRAELDRSLRKNPATTYVNACKAWNTASGTVPGWPAFQITRPSRTSAWTLPWQAFPPSLQQDVQRGLTRLSGEDLLDKLAFRPVRPATLQLREYQLRQTASALVLAGRPAEELRGLADLVSVPAFKAALRYLIDRRGGAASSQVVDIAQMLKSVARHMLRAPQADLDAMSAIIRRLGERRRGLTETNRTRLRPFDDPVTAGSLVNLPQRLAAEAKRAKSPRTSALLVQTAIAIELLLMAPIRIGNLAALDLERHVVRTAKGRRVSIVVE